MAEGWRSAAVLVARLHNGEWSASQIGRFLATGILSAEPMRIPYDPRILQGLQNGA